MTDTNDPLEPSADECSANAQVGPHRWAAWYPQMGGYVGKAVVEVVPTASHGYPCYEVWVWHDGEFPFRGEDGFRPIRLHHCVAEQFVRFGQFLQSKSEPK